MNTSIQQIYIFFLFMLVGIAIAIVFDIFRVLRRTFKTADSITFIEDILFWAITAFILLYAIFVCNHGEIRFYLFIAILLGSIVYLVTLSNAFVKINVKIVSLLIAPFQAFFTFFLKIFRNIAKKWYSKKEKKKMQPKFSNFLRKITRKRRILVKDVEKNN